MVDLRIIRRARKLTSTMSQVNRAGTTSKRRIEFTKGPFGFDPSGNLRCSKCGSYGWEVDGKVAGIPWNEKQRLRPRSPDSMERLPTGWHPSGEIDSSGLPFNIWNQLLRQTWLQIRHVETQRLSYATLFGGVSVAGAVFTITTGQALGNFLVAVFIALAAYSFLQSLLTEKLGQAVEHDQEHINLLIALSPVDPGLVSAGMFRPMDGMIVRGTWRSVMTRRLIPLLYRLMSIGWLLAAIVVVILRL